MKTITLKTTDPKQNARALELLQEHPETLAYLRATGPGTMETTGPDKEMELLQYNLGIIFEDASFDSYIMDVKTTRTAEEVEADLDALYKTIMMDMAEDTELARFRRLIELDPQMPIIKASKYMRWI